MQIFCNKNAEKMKKTIKDYIQEAADHYVLGAWGAGEKGRKAFIAGIKKGVELMQLHPEEATKLLSI